MAGPWHTLSTAIIAAINADTGSGGLMETGAAMLTGVYNTQAPQGAGYPYIILDQVSAPALKAFDADGNTINWQFGVYVSQFNDNATNLDGILERLKVLFDDVTLTLGGSWSASRSQYVQSSNTVIVDDVLYRADEYTVLLTR